MHISLLLETILDGDGISSLVVLFEFYYIFFLIDILDLESFHCYLMNTGINYF